MKPKDIKRFLRGQSFEGESPDVIETHISWVILAGKWAYKIKKPVKFSFLDFSTLYRRRHYCFEEVRLNRRLAGDMYIAVKALRRDGDQILISDDESLGLVDYAVKMRRKDENLRMDHLASRGIISRSSLKSLASKIASFHGRMPIVLDVDTSEIIDDFRDILHYRETIEKRLPDLSLEEVIRNGFEYVQENLEWLKRRLRRGMYRDIHGDLHCQNIFLYPDPVIFDCIEFNDDLRRIDLLNEVAFLCMDLESHGLNDEAKYFLHEYLKVNPIISSREDQELFLFYKAYRANVRAKVYAVHASGENRYEDDDTYIHIEKYIQLMQNYVYELNGLSGIDAGHIHV